LSKKISEEELEKIAKSIAAKIGSSDEKMAASGGLGFRCPVKFKCTNEYNCTAPHQCSADAYTHKLQP
jgi:hypothetical protein